MNGRIVIVAAREFRQIAAARSFWITLLIIPLALALGPIASHFMEKPNTESVMLIDATGRVAPAIQHRIELEQQRRVLSALARYAARYGLARAEPSASWALPEHYFSDGEVAAFLAQGGAAHASQAMARVAPPGTPDFAPPQPDYRFVLPPPDIRGRDAAALTRALPGLINPSEQRRRSQELDYAVYIPADFLAEGRGVQIWSDGAPSAGLMDAVQAELTRILRNHFLEDHGVASVTAAAAGRIVPAIGINQPPRGEGHQQVIVRSILPLLISYVLLVSLMLSGSWMLQGTVEERSNKLIETLLACVSPNELMHGKLIGTVAVGLTMVLFWLLCAVGAAFATQGIISEFLRPALAPLGSPGIVIAMIFYFVAGYLMVAMIFLAIGAMSDSFRDAQAYLTPVLLVIAMPYAIIAQQVLRDPSGLAVRIMSWIPLYAPFIMLARLGTSVPAWEIVGCGLVLALFVAAEVVLLGRVFRASLLNAGAKPNFVRLGRLMMGREVE
ncbi:ABC transporter permease [Sphingomonas sp.]|uniref:ABC transporter permease n=1 Tax=Sphingomonas sp. TaxID=28214 RepID=UPI003B3A125C